MASIPCHAEEIAKMLLCLSGFRLMFQQHKASIIGYIRPRSAQEIVFIRFSIWQCKNGLMMTHPVTIRLRPIERENAEPFILDLEKSSL